MCCTGYSKYWIAVKAQWRMISYATIFALYFSWTTPFVVLFGAKAKKSLSKLSFIFNFDSAKFFV
jgi:hypothetical protein